MKLVKKIALVAVVAFVALQFFRPPKNDTPPGPDDLIVRYAPPPEVKQLLEVSCYDCHSNRTRYPWYAQVQPTGWWLAKHIEDGKSQLNFSAFGAYSEHRRAQKLLAVSDEALGGTMPLKSYTWIHRDARLSAAQAQLLSDWAETLAEEIEEEN